MFVNLIFFREELFTSQRLVEQKDEEIAVSLMRYEALEASRDEIKGNLDAFTDVLNINSDAVHLSDKSLGSGSFAGRHTIDCDSYLKLITLK